jgi:uncharacterized protein (TIGR03067 family)
LRIAHDRWTFMNGDTEGGSRTVAIDPENNPPLLNMSDWPDKSSRINWAGLIRRQGKAVQIAYTSGGEACRPRSFEKLHSEVLVVTLERD